MIASTAQQGASPTESTDGANLYAPDVRKIPCITTLRLLPAAPRAGDEMLAAAEVDQSDKGPTTLLYEWSVNGQRIPAATGPRFKGLFVKGDRVSVVITPERAGVRGMPLLQTAVIQNSPPLVQTDLGDTSLEQNHYRCRVVARDPDGDVLLFRLVKGPKTIKIDPRTGELEGDFSRSDAGAHNLTVSVKDGDGAEVLLKVPVMIGFQR